MIDHRPHVSHNSGENEWYTPPAFIESARRTMGSIDTDPASSELANQNIRADIYYTIQDDGMVRRWYGNVWMNPPYSQPLIEKFTRILCEKYECGEITQACVLVNNATETAWYRRMFSSCAAICFVKGRIRFIDKFGELTGRPLQGQTILYFGPRTKEFSSEFSQYGMILYPAALVPLGLTL